MWVCVCVLHGRGYVFPILEDSMYVCMHPTWRVVCIILCVCVFHIYFHKTYTHMQTYPHTRALSHREKILVTLGGQSCLLPLRHISCNLHWLRPVFENLVLRGTSFWTNNWGARQKKQHKPFKDIRRIVYKTNCTLQHEVYKAFKLKIYSCKFLILPAVFCLMIYPSDGSDNFMFWATVCSNKTLAVLLVLLNSEFQSLRV